MSHITTNEHLANLERMARVLNRKLDSLLSASNLTIELEIMNMADFKELADTVAKIKGTVNSSKAVISGLRARIEEMAAGFNDTADQAAIMALSAELGASEAELARAIATEPGGSTGNM